VRCVCMSDAQQPGTSCHQQTERHAGKERGPGQGQLDEQLATQQQGHKQVIGVHAARIGAGGRALSDMLMAAPALGDKKGSTPDPLHLHGPRACALRY